MLNSGRNPDLVVSSLDDAMTWIGDHGPFFCSQIYIGSRILMASQLYSEGNKTSVNLSSTT